MRLDGSVPQKQRQQLVSRFQTDAGCRVFLTTNAGATGLNLQAADTVINVDLPWNPALLEQRIARAHRMGQKRPVQVYLLVTEDTIEENLLATLSAKHELAAAVLDPDSDLRGGAARKRHRGTEAAARSAARRPARSCAGHVRARTRGSRRIGPTQGARGRGGRAACSLPPSPSSARSCPPRIRACAGSRRGASRPVFGNVWRPARTARSASPSPCLAWRRWMGWPLRWHN